MTIKSLLVKIGADVSEFESGLKSTQSKLQGYAGTFKKVGTAMGIAGGAIVGTLGMAIKKTTELGDQIDELSQKTGVSTETLSGYRVAAEMAGVPLDAFAKNMGFLARNMVGVGTEAETSKSALAALGIETKNSDGSLKSLDSVMLAVADTFKTMPDGAEKMTAANKLFGKSGQDLIPILNQGSEGLKKIYDDTLAAGMVFTKEGAQGCSKFDDSMTMLKTSVQGLGATVAQQLMPALRPLIESVTKIVQGVIGWIKENPKLAGTLLKVFGVLGGAGVALAPLLMALTALTGPAGVIGLVIAGILALGTLIVTNWKEISEFAVSVWTGIKDFFVGIWESIKTAVITVWTEISNFFTGLWTTIKGGFVGAWESITAGFVAFGASIGEAVQGFVQSIVDKFMWLWNRVKEITTWIKDHTVGIFKKMWDKVSGHSIVPSMVNQVLDHFARMRLGISGIMGEVGTVTEAGFGSIASYADAMMSAATGSFTGMADSLKGSIKAIIQKLEMESIALIINKVLVALPFPANLIASGGAIAAVKALFSAIKLGEGGIVTGPTLAMIGEAGPEAVIPLNKAGAFGGAGVTLHQSVYFYGSINNAGDLDEISRRLAERTTQAISKGRRY